MNPFLWLKKYCYVILLAVLLAACSGAEPASRVYAWIDVPADGLAFPSIQPMQIVGHATAPDGVASVEIWINSVLLTTISDPPSEDTLANFSLEWTPPVLGEYTIQLIAYGPDGTASRPDSARVTFGEEMIVPGVTHTPEIPVYTETPTIPPQAVARFWADSTQVAAGACTMLRWHAENVKRLIYNRVDQPFDGSVEVCLCEAGQYTLVVVYLDDTQKTHTVNITVTGSCFTPTPPPDNTPPPAPAPSVPGDNLTLSCRSSQNLVWLPVTDHSGIAQYQLEVQRHAGDNNWQNVSGSPFTGITDKQFTISVECGWYYHWRVRAVDGAGNIGPWSGWSRFTITLI